MALNGWEVAPAAERARRGRRRLPPMTREERMVAVLEFIIGYKVEHDGMSPTVKEIGAQVGISSTSVVCYHLDLLEADGRIRRPFGKARGIEVVGGRWVAPVELEHS